MPVGATRAEILTAAGAAWQQGNLRPAVDLFERAALTPPPAAEAAATSAAIAQYARFRALIGRTALGDEDQARAHLQELEKTPDAPFARLAQQFWNEYSMTAQAASACAAVQPQLASQSQPTLQILQAAGIAVDPEGLCRLPVAR